MFWKRPCKFWSSSFVLPLSAGTSNDINNDRDFRKRSSKDPQRRLKHCKREFFVLVQYVASENGYRSLDIPKYMEKNKHSEFSFHI